MYRFAAASTHEPIVFGAARPGYQNDQVREWLQLMQQQEIQRVCCLLPLSQLAGYAEDLLEVYRQTFGAERVCWTPIEDFQIADSPTLVGQILPFLLAADASGEKVVVHCAGGIGRTGQVLAAWLVAGRGFSVQQAIAAVKQTGRNPQEAVAAAPFKGRNPWKVKAALTSLLAECERFRDRLN